MQLFTAVLLLLRPLSFRESCVVCAKRVLRVLLGPCALISTLLDSRLIYHCLHSARHMNVTRTFGVLLFAFDINFYALIQRDWTWLLHLSGHSFCNWMTSFILFIQVFNGDWDVRSSMCEDRWICTASLRIHLRFASSKGSRRDERNKFD